MSCLSYIWTGIKLRKNYRTKSASPDNFLTHGQSFPQYLAVIWIELSPKPFVVPMVKSTHNPCEGHYLTKPKYVVVNDVAKRNCVWRPAKVFLCNKTLFGAKKKIRWEKKNYLLKQVAALSVLSILVKLSLHKKSRKAITKKSFSERLLYLYLNTFPYVFMSWGSTRRVISHITRMILFRFYCIENLLFLNKI